MLAYLLLGITYAFAAAAQPGVFQTYIISQSLAHGWRRALPAALAPFVSDIPVVTLTLFVLTRLPTDFAVWIRMAGGLFVLYLAWGGYRAWRTYDPAKLPPPPSGRESVLKAALVNVLNPNPYIAWSLVLGPLLLKGWREAPSHGLALVAAFYTTIIVSTAAIIVLFGTARKLGPRVSRALVGISAAALACFGAYLLFNALSSVVMSTSPRQP